MTVNQLIQDEAFIQWVLAPAPESDNHWNNWLLQNPDKRETLLQAKAWIIKIHDSQHDSKNSSANIREEVWQSIKANIQHPPIQQKRFNYKRLMLVASLMTAFLSITYYFVGSGDAPGEVPALAITTPADLFNENYALKRANESDTGKTVYLTDGTKVILEPGSYITNNVLFREAKREVHLTGSAFFEVARDTARPFFVYTHDVVVKVLGTSFKIVADQQKEKLIVAVHNGKVSVLAPDKDKRVVSHILQCNELIEVNKKNSVAAKSRVIDSLFVTPPPIAHVNFTFEDAPVEDIFKQLETVYNINIMYSREKLSNCRLTTSLDAESFYNKLNIVCLALHADYQIKDNKIQISGEGCN